MQFNSIVFWPFFAVILLTYYSVARPYRNGLIVAAGFLFYGALAGGMVVFLAGFIAGNFVFGRLIDGAGGRRRRIWLLLAVALDLMCLAYWKYATVVVSMFGLGGGGDMTRVLVPVAVSFYTFEAISYNVDVYGKVLPASRSIVDFSFFITFFPHLVSGPIIRPGSFFPQMEALGTPSNEDVVWATTQILKGLIKKCIFSDYFATLANPYFSTGAGHGNVAAAWVGVMAFTMQIYCDFAGYTDIARGCSKLLGFDFPINFDRPYLASSISDFWRRWHVSLSSWLRDYLYIPLGGNRKGRFRTYANLVITMVLGGVWHGASWNFLVWGLYHGIGLALEKAVAAIWPGGGPVGRRQGRSLLSVPLTFLFVVIGWVPFRAPDFATTLAVYRDLTMLDGTGWGADQIPTKFIGLLLTMGIWVLADRGRRVQRWLGAGGAGIKVPVAVAVSLLALELLSQTDIQVPFVYFRF